MQISHLELQDHDQIMLDDWTLQPYNDLFKVSRKDLLPYERSDNVWISVTIEMDLNLMTYERTLYTMFDLLSDVGGLSGILVTIFTIIMTIWNYNSFDNMMVANLFNIKAKDAEEDFGLRRSTPQEIRISQTPHFKEKLISCFSARCTTCCKRRKELAMSKARDKLAEETNITEIIQSRRYI